MKRFIACIGLLCCLAGCSKRSVETASQRPLQAPSRDISARQVRVYPYSLIPGGVETEGEFQAYREVDPKLADHYRDVRASLAVTTLAADKWLYASYRTTDGIYWTKKRLLVHRGEAVLTDGEHMVRARCGNRLAETAQKPVRKFEPPLIASDEAEPDAEVNALENPPEIVPTAPAGPDLPGLPHVDRPREALAQTAPTPSAPAARQTLQWTPGPGVLPSPGRGVSALYVPEAGTGTLFLAGLIVMLASSWFLRMRRKHR